MVTFSLRSATLESVDTVTVTIRGETAEVTCDARINFRGLLRVTDPLLALASVAFLNGQFEDLSIVSPRPREHVGFETCAHSCKP